MWITTCFQRRESTFVLRPFGVETKRWNNVRLQRWNNVRFEHWNVRFQRWNNVRCERLNDVRFQRWNNLIFQRWNNIISILWFVKKIKCIFNVEVRRFFFNLYLPAGKPPACVAKDCELKPRWLYIFSLCLFPTPHSSVHSIQMKPNMAFTRSNRLRNSYNMNKNGDDVYESVQNFT